MIEVTEDMVLAALCKLESDSGVKAAIEAALVEYEHSEEKRKMDNKEIAKRNAEFVDAIKIESARLRRKRDAAEQMLEALNYVADNTYCGADTEWHLKRKYEPQIVLDAIRAAEGSEL